MRNVSKVVCYRRIAAYMYALVLVACAGNQQHDSVVASGVATTTHASAPIDGVGTDALAAFSQTTWGQILSPQCYGCHHGGGMASRMGSGFIFMDKNLPNSLAHNFATARAMAAADSNLFLLKPTLQVGHYGGQVIDPNGPQYKMMQDFVANSRQVATAEPLPVASAYLNQAVVPSAATQVRKAAMVLANRLPTAAEASAVQSNAMTGLSGAIDQYLTEGNFYARLGETYNDMLLVDTYARTATAVGLFSDVPAIDWYNHITWGQNADYQSAVQGTQRALSHEPLNLVAYVARTDLPFTDILTADYMVVNPYSACALGISNQVTFKTAVHCDANDRGKYDETDLQAVTMPTSNTVGVFTTRAFLMRHPTTATNRNRHRFNQSTATFIGFDALVAVPRAAPATSEAQGVPTMTSRNCTDCHAMVDPGAALFQNWDLNGLYTQTPWYTDMFEAGYFGTPMPANTSNPLAWMSTQMASDPRFARRTVAVVYQMLTGNTVGLDPAQVVDPNDTSSTVAYLLQQQAIDAWTTTFQANFSIKSLVKAIVTSPQFQLTDVASNADAASIAVLGASFIHHRLLTPESLARNLQGMFGEPWLDTQGLPLLTNAYYMFYGGIDSSAITVRDGSFTSFKSDITLRLANEMACQLVPLAVSTSTSSQATLLRANLLPGMPTSGPQQLTVAQQRTIMANMRFSLLGETADPNGVEVAAMLALYQSAQQYASQNQAGALPSNCQSSGVRADATGATQGWMAVTAYMLSDENFLYE